MAHNKMVEEIVYLSREDNVYIYMPHQSRKAMFVRQIGHSEAAREQD